MATDRSKPKKTEQNVQSLLTCLRNGYTRYSACGKVGISRQTMYNWIKDDPELLTAIEVAEDFWVSIVEDAKQKKIEEGYRPAVEKELKSKRRSVYGDKIENTNVNLDKDVSAMTDDELMEFINKSR